MKNQNFSRSNFKLLKHLGFDDYASFQDQLYADVILRQDQIRSRMLGLKMDDLFKQIHLCDDQDKFICDLDHICHDISTSKRVVIIGALYPISIAVEFQTDLITFGKPVFQYHSFDNQLILNKDDYVILFQQQEELMMRLWSNIKVLILIVHNSYLLPKIKSLKVKLAKNV